MECSSSQKRSVTWAYTFEDNCGAGSVAHIPGRLEAPFDNDLLLCSNPHSAEGLTRKGIFGKVRKKQTGEENVREY